MNVFEFAGRGSGGIGAVSVGLIEFVPDLILFIAAAAANRLIAPWARISGALVRRLHLVHAAVIVSLLILSMVFIAGVLFMTPAVILIDMLLMPLVFIAQLAIMSILLALFAWQRTRPALTSG